MSETQSIPECVYNGASGNAYLFNSVDDVPDSESESSYGLRPTLRGMTLDTAMKKAMVRPEKLRERNRYQEFTPCVRCSNCIIIQEFERGSYANNTYLCRMLQSKVARYGTCTCANPGRLGATVIQRDKDMAEIMANKGNLVN